MPLYNGFYGVYKIAKVFTGADGASVPSPYIIKSIQPSNSMEATAVFFMQGDPRTKVLNIGHTKEEIKVTSPILVPQEGQSAANVKDGRVLLADKVDNSYTDGFPNGSLPILTNAVLDIGESESSITLTLLSDGDPNNTTNVYSISNSSTTLINEIGLNYAARVAKNWDFAVQLGDLIYYVKSAQLTINVKSSEEHFLGVAANDYWASNFSSVPYDGTNSGVWSPVTDAEKASYTGWQFPFIAVGGITIEATGTATLIVDSDNPSNNVNYSRAAAVVNSRSELIANGNVTLQHPGELTFTQSNFNIYQIYKDGSTINVIPDAMAVNSAIVKMKSANFNEGLMTVNFSVTAFVGAS